MTTVLKEIGMFVLAIFLMIFLAFLYLLDWSLPNRPRDE